MRGYRGPGWSAAGQPATRGGNPGGIKAHLRQQFPPFAMLNEPIGQTESDDRTVGDAGIGHQFEDGAAKAGWQRVLLNRHRPGGGFNSLLEGRIEWLDEAGVDHCHFEPVVSQFRGGLEGLAHERAAGDDESV